MPFHQNLIEKLRDHKVIPFVGAGVSMAIQKCNSSEALFPSWKQLLLKAAKRLEGELKPDEANLVKAFLKSSPPKYLEAAKHAQEHLGSIFYEVLKAILWTFLRLQNKALAKMPAFICN
jgi:hypothetical protein